MFKGLQPIAEKWVNRPLKPSPAFGFKRYVRGTHLQEHVDKIGIDRDNSLKKSAALNLQIAVETRVGVILHVNHDTDEPWPLKILDHDNNIHDVFLEPRQIVIFETHKYKQRYFVAHV